MGSCGGNGGSDARRAYHSLYSQVPVSWVTTKVSLTALDLKLYTITNKHVRYHSVPEIHNTKSRSIVQSMTSRATKQAFHDGSYQLILMSPSPSGLGSSLATEFISSLRISGLICGWELARATSNRESFWSGVKSDAYLRTQSTPAP